MVNRENKSERERAAASVPAFAASINVSSKWILRPYRDRQRVYLKLHDQV